MRRLRLLRNRQESVDVVMPASSVAVFSAFRSVASSKNRPSVFANTLLRLRASVARKSFVKPLSEFLAQLRDLVVRVGPAGLCLAGRARVGRVRLVLDDRVDDLDGVHHVASLAWRPAVAVAGLGLDRVRN